MFILMIMYSREYLTSDGWRWLDFIKSHKM